MMQQPSWEAAIKQPEATTTTTTGGALQWPHQHSINHTDWCNSELCLQYVLLLMLCCESSSIGASSFAFLSWDVVCGRISICLWRRLPGCDTRGPDPSGESIKYPSLHCDAQNNNWQHPQFNVMTTPTGGPIQTIRCRSGMILVWGLVTMVLIWL